MNAEQYIGSIIKIKNKIKKDRSSKNYNERSILFYNINEYKNGYIL